MNRVIYIPAPRSNTNLENRIGLHILGHSKNCRTLIPAVPQYAPPRDPVSFYDPLVWVRHQAAVLDLLSKESLQDGDHLFFADAWFPGLEMVRLMYPKVHLIGFVHGATTIPGDRMSGIGWATKIERAWFEDLYSCLLVQTPYTTLGLRTHSIQEKCVVVGSPFSPVLFEERRGTKKTVDVIWPHRCSEDKGFSFFLQVAKSLTAGGRTVVLTTPAEGLPEEVSRHLKEVGVQVWTGSVGKRHRENISQARLVLSTAVQETWGYGVMEAVASGAFPIVPNDACYPYLYPDQCRYDRYATPEEVATFCELALHSNFTPPKMPAIDIVGDFVDGRFFLR